MWKRILSCGAALLLASACNNAQDLEPGELGPEGKTEAAEKIDSSNEPNRFNLTMVRKLVDLPSSGVSLRKPFPSNWWPMRHGGAAQEWLNGQPSPTMKYDLLVHPDEIKDVELTLAKKDAEGEPVNEDAEPETFHIGPATEWEHKNHGRYGTTDPDSWWGHCNGWSAYVLNEDEPTRPVRVKMEGNVVVECAADEQGGVTWELGDINALGSELYWSDAARMLGRRCEQESSEFEFDEAGRINAIACRDGNPGSMHIIAANMLGIMERPYVVDLNADFQVWNYPAYKFEVVRNDPMTLQQAIDEVDAPEGTTTWIYNDEATQWARIRMKVAIVSDSIPPSTEPAGDLIERYTSYDYYDYILELDDAGEIIGGEWLGSSKTNHPDFLWYSYGNSSYGTRDDDLWDRDNKHIRYSVWKQILTLAQNEPAPPEGVVRKKSSPNLAIPDDNATGISDIITMDESFTTEKATVAVNITHSYRGDLIITLEHAGRTSTLFSKVGGGTDDVRETFTAGDFVGMEAAGAWTIKVVDTAGADVGTLDDWTLELTKGQGGGGGDEELVVSGTPSLAIPDNDAAGISHDLTVGESFDATSVKVDVDITHTYRGDLVVSLVRSGQRYTLHNKTGGGTDNLQESYTISELEAVDVAGTWTLEVSDNAGADLGTLNSWSITLGRDGGSGGGGDTVTRVYDEDASVSIPDNDPAGASSIITINDEIRIDELKVTVNITHTYIGDLKVTLSNGEATQTLHENAGGSTDDLNQTFETMAFNSGNSKGTWTLKAVDSAGYDTGSIDAWKITITGVEQ